MPYIKQKDRKRIEKEKNIASFGELNYLIYREMVKQWKLNSKYLTIHTIKQWSNHISYLWGCLPDGVYYRGLNTDLLTAGELAFMEFYRRYAVPYENKAKKRNGDVY